MDLQPWDYYDADLRPKGHTAQILSTFQRAIEAIPYDEPPGWHAPTRHRLGAALLAAGDAAGAEAVYRQELQRNPANGWSLLGLAQSLDAQGRDSAEVREAMSAAWRHADVNLGASHF